MKILQINALYGNKSTGSIVKDIHSLLISRGVDSRVACVSATDMTDGVITLGYGVGSRLHALMSRVNGGQGFYSRGKTRALLRALSKDKPDIIHIHNLHSNFINLPLLFEFAAKNGIPIMMTLHDAWYFTGKCYHFLDNGCDRWMRECHDCPKRGMDIPSIFDRSREVFRKKAKAYSYVELHVVGCSRWITECAEKSPMLSHAEFHQIYNGVDSDVFNPEVEDLRAEIGLSGFTVLTMANKWFDPKNEQTRDTVLSLLRERGGELIIVGCNPEQAETYKGAEHIRCLGYITDRGYMARLYRSADVFLNMTLVDTLPTVNIESAMCGTPIVTYDSGGSGELVLDGVTGYVVKPLDAWGVAGALCAVMDGKIGRDDCSRFAIERFEKTKNYEKYLDLYGKIYESKGKSNG